MNANRTFDFQPMPERRTKIRKYVRASFTSDVELQQAVDLQMSRLGRRLKLTFIAMFCLFALTIAIAALGFPIAILISIPCFIALVIYSTYNLIPRRNYCCRKCNDRMEIEWSTESGSDARFAVCPGCKTYIDTLWTSR